MRTPPPSPSPAKRISLCFLCCYFFFLLSLLSLSSSSINALSRSLSPEKDPGPLTLRITPQSLNTHLHQCRTSTRTSNSDCEEKMDPPLISESSFSAANPSAYCLEEIWPFGAAGAGGGEPTGSGLRISQSHPGGGFGESSGNRDGGSVEESTVTEQSGAGAGRKRKDVSSEDESSKMVSTSSANDLNNTNGKRTKLTGSKYEIGGPKAEAEASSMGGDKPAEQATKPSEPPKQDYIHVRARRGQATDSHSLAERARREKISERMKILQDLVPGCNKVIGKALVLDEIINYIQSLQRQVEFLSMKLEALNSRMNLNPAIEGFPSKDLGLQAYDDATGLLFGSQAPRGYAQGSPPEWLHMQIGGSFERPT